MRNHNYRLADALGGHPVTVIHGMARNDGQCDIEVTVGGHTPEVAREKARALWTAADIAEAQHA